MSDPDKPAPPPFPMMGVTRAGEALPESARPAPPVTAPVDRSAVEALIKADAAQQIPTAPEASAGSILLLDDDFFGAMELADAVAALRRGEVRTAATVQKAEAILAEGPVALAVLALGTGEVLALATRLAGQGVPFAFVADSEAERASASAHPDAPIVGRDPVALCAALEPLWS